jgi:hypothetical protein
MIQTTISAATYKANILKALQQTGIANTAPGGKARAFCDIIGDQLGTLDSNKPATWLSPCCLTPPARASTNSPRSTASPG